MREVDSVNTVRRKVDRLRRARGQKHSLFRALAHVGVLGWLMILPLVGFTALGHALDVMFAMRSLALSGVLLGLVIGGYLVWRSVDRELEEPVTEVAVTEIPANEDAIERGAEEPREP